MEATLYGVGGSPNVLIAQLMLEHKGLTYRRIDLPHVVHRLFVRALGFPGYTVPAIRIDGARAQGTRAISRALEGRYPDRAPLFPEDAAARRRVEDAERWGEDELQPLVRYVFWPAMQRDPSGVRSFLEGAPMIVPVGLTVRLAPVAIAVNLRLYGSDAHVAHEHLLSLPRCLDRADALIEEGVLGGDHLTAADYQVSATFRNLMSLDDLRPLISARPCGELALRAVPDYPGRIPPVLTTIEREALERALS